jgi:hypothetical protein
MTGLFEAIVWDRTESSTTASRWRASTATAGRWTTPTGVGGEHHQYDRYLFNRSMHYKLYEKMART